MQAVISRPGTHPVFRASSRPPPQSKPRSRHCIIVRASGPFADELIGTARTLCTPGKGILAIDESPGSCGARLATIGLENTAENRRRWRDLLMTAASTERFISGIILHEETLLTERADVVGDVNNGVGTLSQNSASVPDMLHGRGIVPGVKVDRGLIPLPNSCGEVWATGLDDLAVRCSAYYAAGARFAKWRTVVRVGAGPGSPALLEAAHGLGRYAAIAQSCGLVPVVEPEVTLEGSHDIDAALSTALSVWAATFKSLSDYGVLLEGIVLKPSMVTSGSRHGNPADPDTVADYTLRLVRRVVPPAVPGIFFLSGGLSDEAATLNLNAMNSAEAASDRCHPWHISFSFARALQGAALEAWGGRDENVQHAQRALLRRARMCSAAQQGTCDCTAYHDDSLWLGEEREDEPAVPTT